MVAVIKTFKALHLLHHKNCLDNNLRKSWVFKTMRSLVVINSKVVLKPHQNRIVKN